MKKTKLNAIQVTGIAVASSLIVGGGVFAVMNSQSNGTQEVSETGAKASSGATIWQDIEESPDGWTFNSGGGNGEDEGSGQNSLFGYNGDKTCNFSLEYLELDKPEFDGIGSDYRAIDRVTGYGVNRDAKNAKVSLTDVKTSEGDIPFWNATYELKYDITGDGKADDVKETRLGHAYSELTTKDDKVPYTEIGYVCSDSKQWSQSDLDNLIDATTLNISGDPYDQKSNDKQDAEKTQ